MATADLDPTKFEPWHPMSHPIDIKTIGKGLEEAGELTEQCGKLVKIMARCLIQGMDGLDPETGLANKTAFENEVADIMANLDVNTDNFQLDRLRINEQARKKAVFLKGVHAGA